APELALRVGVLAVPLRREEPDAVPLLRQGRHYRLAALVRKAGAALPFAGNNLGIGWDGFGVGTLEQRGHAGGPFLHAPPRRRGASPGARRGKGRREMLPQGVLAAEVSSTAKGGTAFFW